MFNKEKPQELSFIELQKSKFYALADEFSAATNQIELLINSLSEMSREAEKNIAEIDEKIGELCVIKHDYALLKDSHCSYHADLKRMSSEFSKTYNELTRS